MNLSNLPDDILNKINNIVKEEEEIETFYKNNKDKMILDFIVTDSMFQELISTGRFNLDTVNIIVNKYLSNTYTPEQIEKIYIQKWMKAKRIIDF